MPSSILDSVDEFLIKYSGPWGLAQSALYYDETPFPSFSRYDDRAPDPTPPSSVFDIAYTILLCVFAFVMICAALLPTYLAFESEIWGFVQRLDNLMEAIHEAFHDRVPLEINRYDDFFAPETVKTQTAGLSKAIQQQSTGLSRQGLAGFRRITPSSTKRADVEYVHRMLTEIKLHSESNYNDLMHDFKICQQMLARQSYSLEENAQQQRKALQVATAERDDVEARYWALFLQQPAIRQEYTRFCMLVLMISHSEHTKVLDTFCKAALEVGDLHNQELAAKDNLLQQTMMQHQRELAVKDQTARKKEMEQRQQMTRAASAYASLQKQHDSLKKQHESLQKQHEYDALEHIEQQEADADAKVEYIRVFEREAEEVDEQHAVEMDTLQAKHAAEKQRLELRAEKLTDKCKALNLARRNVEEQNVQATTLLQLKEAEAALQHLTGKVKPAMKRLATDLNRQSVTLRDHLEFCVKLWHGYLELTEKLDEAPSQDLTVRAEFYLGLDTHGEKTRPVSTFPILDMDSLLGVFNLPGVRKAGDPPRITSLAWGAMEPAVDAPVETFIEWLVEEDFSADRWVELRQLAYKLARVSSPYNIRRILAKCHELRRRGWDQN